MYTRHRSYRSSRRNDRGRRRGKKGKMRIDEKRKFREEGEEEGLRVQGFRYFREFGSRPVPRFTVGVGIDSVINWTGSHTYLRAFAPIFRVPVAKPSHLLEKGWVFKYKNRRYRLNRSFEDSTRFDKRNGINFESKRSNKTGHANKFSVILIQHLSRNIC